MTHDLSLPEEVALLCLDDVTGKSTIPLVHYGLEGAALADLMLQGRIQLQDRRQVAVLNPQPTGNPVLDGVLERIQRDGGPGKPNNPDFAAAVCRRLVERGILRDRGGSLAWAEAGRAYPTQDGAPEQALRERLRSALLGSSSVDARTGALIALLKGLGGLQHVLSSDEMAARRDRVSAIYTQAAAGRSAAEAHEAALQPGPENPAAEGGSRIIDFVLQVLGFTR